MGKKVVIVKYHNLPVYISEIKEVEAEEYVKLSRESEKNLVRLLAEKNKETEELKKEIHELWKEIKLLKGVE